MEEKGCKASSGVEVDVREDARLTRFRSSGVEKQRGGDRERLLCFLLEDEGIQSWGVMSTIASIYALHLHDNTAFITQKHKQTHLTSAQRKSGTLTAK